MEEFALERGFYALDVLTHGYAQCLRNGGQGAAWQAGVIFLPIPIVRNGAIQRKKEQARELKAARWLYLLQPRARCIKQPICLRTIRQAVKDFNDLGQSHVRCRCKGMNEMPRFR
jgi:hypothetical protein